MKATQPISADGFPLKRGMTVHCLHTKDAGKTWSVHKAKVAHTTRTGRLTFDEKKRWWQVCLPLQDQVGDHRIFKEEAAAKAEADKRNKPKVVYRYKVTHISGSMKKAVKVGQILLEEKYLGKDYTWQFFNTKTGKKTGNITGIFVNKAKLSSDGKRVLKGR